MLSSRGHLANTDSLAFVVQLAEERLQLVVLAHLSEINNHPDLVLREARQRLPGEKTLRVLLAGQGQVSPLLEILP